MAKHFHSKLDFWIFFFFFFFFRNYFLLFYIDFTLMVFHSSTAKISEILNKWNSLKIRIQTTYPIMFLYNLQPFLLWEIENFKVITKTCLYNFDPLKPHFYIVKPGFTRVYIIFLISAQKHRLWVLVRTASPRRFYRVPTIYVLSGNMKNIRVFYLKIFSFWR